MKKTYAKIYDSNNQIIARRVLKGFDNKKDFKRYALPFAFHGLSLKNKKDWKKIEIFSYENREDIATGKIEKIRTIKRWYYSIREREILKNEKNIYQWKG